MQKRYNRDGSVDERDLRLAQEAEWLRIFITYLIVMNVISFCMMAYDKGQAGRRGRRVPEKRLFGYAACGGALGAWMGMYAYRHKTKHASFIIGMPALLVVNVVLVYFIGKGLSLKG